MLHQRCPRAPRITMKSKGMHKPKSGFKPRSKRFGK